MSEMYYLFLSDSEIKKLEKSRTNENYIEYKTPYKCITCKYYTKYTGCILDSDQCIKE